jgi:uncharacterized protein YceH (UPF0502 family)
MALTLSPVETRILGCLIEKERTTPDVYPLSLLAVTTACNQSTNRDPVVHYTEQEVNLGLDDLRGKQLATKVWGAGARVEKFRHNLLDVFELNPGEVALLCVLLLRGPQTPGELRIRSERLHPFESIADLEKALEALAAGDAPLVRMLEPRPGQKERRFVQLLSGEPVLEVPSFAAAPSVAAPVPGRLEALEAEVAGLKTSLAELREELARFRKQFE